MAWVLYNAKKHGLINGKRVRFTGWDNALAITNRSPDATAICIHGLNLTKDEAQYLVDELHEYSVATDRIRVKIPGYSSYGIPFDLLDIWVDNTTVSTVHNGIDYSVSDYVDVTPDTLLVSTDMVRIKTRTQLSNQHKAHLIYSGSDAGGLDVTDVSPRIKDIYGASYLRISEGSMKKLRSGVLIDDRLDRKNMVVSMVGVDKSVYKIPCAYLEVKFSGRVSVADRLAQNNVVTDKPQQTNKSKTHVVPTEKNKEIPKMELHFNAKEMMEQNKDALLVAAKIEVGEVAVQHVTKIVKKQLPLMMKGYADLPIFEIVIANIVVMAIKQFCPENKKAQVIADAMLLAAMQKQIKEFNIPRMVEEFTSGIDISGITKLTSKSSTEE